MSANLKPYPETKDSGVAWLGSMPQHWELRRTKTLLSQRSEKGFPHEPLLAATQTIGVVRKDEYENRTVLALKDLQLLKLVRIGDFVISLRSFQGGIESARHQGIISPAYTIVYPVDRAHHVYLSYLFKSLPYIENLSFFVTGIRQGQNIDYEKLGRSLIPLPPLSEQTEIVRFLNRADRLIRRYIRAKQKLIALLEEQKQAIIREAVTGQIDVRTGRLYPLYKTSGEEWLGDVPEHWRVRKLSWLFRYSKGSNAAALTKEYIGLHRGRYRVYSGQTENGGLMGVIDSFEFEYSTPVILVTTVGARAMSTRLVSGRFSLSQNCALIAPREQTLDTSYYEGVLGIMFDFERRSISLTMQPSLRFEDLDKFRVPIPPSEEQRAIARYIIRSVAEMNSVSSHADRAIKLLNEYRTRLIADVVTGKLDVRSAAAELHNGRSPQT